MPAASLDYQTIAIWLHELRPKIGGDWHEVVDFFEGKCSGTSNFNRHTFQRLVETGGRS